MFENAKNGERVWDFSFGWGTITNIDKSNLPIGVSFDNGRYREYTFDGKFHKEDLNPRLFWNELKYEIPEKPFNLENELRKMEVTEFKLGRRNYYLYWDNYNSEIVTCYQTELENPISIYFYKTSIDDFLDSIKDKDVTKEQFLKAYKNVFIMNLFKGDEE